MGLTFLRELEFALRKIYSPIGGQEIAFVSFLDPVPNEILKKSLSVSDKVYIVAVTGSQGERSVYTHNTHGDVVELDCLFSCVSPSQKKAYEGLQSLFSSFGYGLSLEGILYKKSNNPFLLHGDGKIMVHEISFYGGTFTPVLDRYENFSRATHEAVIALSLEE